MQLLEAKAERRSPRRQKRGTSGAADDFGLRVDGSRALETSDADPHAEKKLGEQQDKKQAALIERRAPTAVELPRAAYLTNNYCWKTSERLLMATAVRDIERAKPALQHGLDDAPASRAK